MIKLTCIEELKKIAAADNELLFRMESWQDAMEIAIYLEKRHNVAISPTLCTEIDRGKYRRHFDVDLNKRSLDKYWQIKYTYSRRIV